MLEHRWQTYAHGLGHQVFLYLGCWSLSDDSAIFPPPAPFVAFFVLAFFGGSGGWAVFPVPLIFPGFRQLCWNLAFAVVPE